MGKEKKHNEFFYFMLEKKPEVEKRLGRAVPMSEMPQHVGAEWKSLPDSKKKKYTTQKNKHNRSLGKLDCRGRPLKELEEEMEAKRRKEEEMVNAIQGMVDLYRAGNALSKATVYIFSASHYTHTDEGSYVPAELGAVQFNLQRGIIKECNIILKPMIPQSYGYLSQEHSEATHNLLNENNLNGKDYDEAVKELCEFVTEVNNKVPPLYTLEEEMAQAEGVLKYIGVDDYFKVYSLETLFQHIYASIEAIPISVAQDMLSHCGYDYHPDMACRWHKVNHPDSGKYCTLSCARRWAFLICDHLKLEENYNITPQEGKHLPRALPARGVLVDVPRTSFKDFEGASEASIQKPTPAAGKMKDDAFSFAPSKPASSVGIGSLDATYPWDHVEKGAAREMGTSSGTKPQPKARMASSLFAPPSFDTSSDQDDFPPLGAGRAKTGVGSQGRPLTRLRGTGRGMTLDQVYMGTLGMGQGQRTMNPRQ